MIDPKLLRGSLDTMILKLLSENEEMYGYEITQKVKDMTEGQIKLTEGALYPALHRLEAQGVLSTEMRPVGNRMRKYYRLTEEGQKDVVEKVASFQQFMDTMKLFLSPSSNVNPA